MKKRHKIGIIGIISPGFGTLSLLEDSAARRRNVIMDDAGCIIPNTCAIPNKTEVYEFTNTRKDMILNTIADTSTKAGIEKQKELNKQIAAAKKAAASFAKAKQKRKKKK